LNNDNEEQKEEPIMLGGDVEYGDINDILDELEAQPSNITPRKHSVLEDLAGWLFIEFSYNTDLFGEKLLDRISAWGKRMLDKYNQQYLVVDKAMMETIHDEANYKVAKKASGIYEPSRLCNAIINMNSFCVIYSKDAERSCMQLNLRANSATRIAAVFYYPAFRWELVKSIFVRA